jgi:transcription termination factor Rho
MWELETHIGKLDYLLGVNYIYVPESMVEILGGLKGGRLVCTLNKKVSFQCGLMSLSNGDAYITINKTRMKQLKLQTGDQVHVQFKKDESEYGMDMCEELQELLLQDIEGKARFDALSPGMQRYIIYYVGQVKSPALRLNRSILLIGNLKELPPGKETFKAILGKE